MLLEYVCADFIDVRVEAGSYPSADYKRHWFDSKAALGMPFGGNLPFFTDGDTGVKLVQSNTILRYCGRKFNLMGDGSTEQTATVDLLLDQLGDFDDGFTGMAYRTYGDGGKEKYLEESLGKVLTG